MEQPSAAKWNILGTNDASFNDGTGLADASVTSEKLSATIAFHAYRNATHNLAQATTQTVVFDTELYDLGSNFDTSTGTFTAPRAGVYAFCAGIDIGAQTNTRGLLQFVGSTFGTVEPTDIEGTKTRNVNATIQIKLVASETVVVKEFHVGATTNVASASTFFSGCFVGAA